MILDSLDAFRAWIGISNRANGTHMTSPELVFIFLLFPLATGLIGPSLVTSPIPIRVKYNTT